MLTPTTSELSVDDRRRLVRDQILGLPSDRVYMGAYAVMSSEYAPQPTALGHSVTSLALSELVRFAEANTCDRLLAILHHCDTAACFLGHAIIALRMADVELGHLADQEYISDGVAELLGVHRSAFHCQWTHWPTPMRLHFIRSLGRRGHDTIDLANVDGADVSIAERDAVVGYLNHLLGGGQP